ncbi:MAG: citrate synthase family protein [Myxococcota bacterium]
MEKIDQHRLIDQPIVDDQSAESISARDAAAFLGVKLPTLYAYASRGLVRSVPAGKGRTRQYLKADLERLRARRDARSGHGPVAANALQWGEPVLDTAITAISSESGPIYRGQLATRLAAADTPFESVAELLWTGHLPSEPAEWIAQDFPMSVVGLRRLLPDDLRPLPALAVVVPLLASWDPGRFAVRSEAIPPRARILLRRLAAALALGRDKQAFKEAFEGGSVARAVAAALGSGSGADGVAAINRALVLCADHELNASTFAARVAASTGADIYACVGAALSTLSGPRHGGAASRVEALINEIGRPEDVERVVNERASRGEPLEGFGHPLYPEGDPRGQMLVELARDVAPRSRPVRTCLALVEAMEGRGRGGATIDVGLVALCSALGLRGGSAVGVFAVGRCAGWVAHAKEQYEAGYVVRPRARYLERD